ncbi:MAG: hypothetical protein K0R39_2267 [Symbiobacteriaceae bacterium]|jgi:HEAT repeat protein|nr:hypothetical protein [Symbiobacteriaceae bacterium]
MSVDELGPLSSQIGQRSEAANRDAAGRCLANPALLEDVAFGLGHKDAAVLGDAAEVMTMVAQVAPGLVAPFAERLVPLLGHQTTRVRWEAMHALALVAVLRPEVIFPLLPRLGELLASDSSVIVRDYATEALGNYAGRGPEAAEQALPYLRQALTAAGGKHAGRALDGLAKALAAAPGLAGELLPLAEQYQGHERGVVRKAARALMKRL